MAKKNAPSLNALRVFDVAARCPSFKQAAQQLGVTQAAVTRQIQALEQQLDMSLFHRDNRVHSLTPAGLELAPQLESIFKQLDQTLARAKHLNDNNTTTLTIAIASARLRFWLNHQLTDFQSLYPHVQLNFVNCEEFLSSKAAAELSTRIQHEGVDLVIAAGDIKDIHIGSQSLGTVELVPCASDPSEELLWQTSWLVDRENRNHQDYIKQQSKQLKHTPFIHCNDTQMALDLAQSQQRIALVDNRYCESESFPKLHTFATHRMTTKPELKLHYRKRRQQSVALVAFMKWLQLVTK
ncbi:LysR family transcriptional regulator [Idiomarina seosinensis]|uniref:LysR family transcriptional regulator n=1 Tax=Idiomarina seosinensis TaxID=281739 RepID=A0A432ZI89_9GAMM|nr:LysR family transcriptional regulator [Idiomarina seosinensis]RUO77540.1 LysR family transcriptional regulator [Idiomarina seosinensis]